MAVFRPVPQPFIGGKQPFEPRHSLLGMAPGIAFDGAGNSGDQAAASSYSGSASWSGTNRLLAVDVSMLGPGVTVSSMTYGNAPCTFIGGISTVTSFGRVEQWRILSSDANAPADGANTLAVTLSGSIEFAVEWASYTGVQQTSPTEGFNSAQATNTGSATDAAVTITTVADNDWVHAAVVANDTSISAGNTSRNNVSGTLGSGANEDNNGPVTPAGNVSMTYTGMGITATWAIAGYAIRPLAAANLGASTTLTGVMGTAGVGTLTATASSAVTLTGVAGTAGISALSAMSGTNPILTGVVGTGAIGALTVTALSSVTLTGVQGTGAVGTSAPIADSAVTLTGVAGTGALATFVLADSAVTLTGVAGAGSVGTLTATASSAVTLIGVQGAGAVNTLVPNIAETLTGVQGTGAAGTLTATASSSVALTGVEAAGSLGTLTVSATSGPVQTLTGVAGTGSVGTLTAMASSAITLTGVASTGSVGTLAPSSIAATTLVSVQATAGVGTLTATSASTAALTGVSGTAGIGALTETHTGSLTLTGVAGTGAAGTVAASVSTNANTAVTGVAGTAAVGTVAGAASSNVTLGSVVATGTVGQLDPSTSSATAQVSLTGVASAGAMGDLSVTSDAASSATAGDGHSKKFAARTGPRPELWVSHKQHIDARIEIQSVEARGAIGPLLLRSNSAASATYRVPEGALSKRARLNMRPSINARVELAGVQGWGLTVRPSKVGAATRVRDLELEDFLRTTAQRGPAQ